MSKQVRKHPPLWADRLLEWYCAPHLVEDLQGDLHQRFQERLRRSGLRSARFFFILDVLMFMRPYVIRRKQTLNRPAGLMFRHYFKTGVRNIRRDTRYVVVNTFGLALGVACALVLTSYIYTELSFDRENRYADRTYRLSWNTIIDSQETAFAPTAPAIGPALKSLIPEIEAMARTMTWSGDGGASPVSLGDKRISVNGIMNADSTIFDVLDYHFIVGTRNALQGRDRIVLTHSLAVNLFGRDYVNDDQLIHKIVTVDKKALAIAGVIDDISFANHFRPSALIAWEGYGHDEVWNDSHAYTYLRLSKDTDPDVVQAKINQFAASNETLKRLKAEYNADVRLYIDPLTDIHLHSHKTIELLPGGNLKYLFAFAGIATFFLLMSGINYINLAIASSWHRYKEIGVRKVMGAMRSQVQTQFLTEASLMITIAFAIGLIMMYFLMPLFNALMGYQLEVAALMTPHFACVVAGMLIALIALSGFYPSFYLSTASPVTVFRNKLHIGGKKVQFRKVLLVAQFSISAIMIVSVLTVTRQINYMSSRSLGFDKENILVIMLPWTAMSQVNALKEELLRVGGVAHVAATDYLPGVTTVIDEHRIERSNGEMGSSSVGRVFFDKDYIQLLSLQVIEGRNFDPSNMSDYQNAFLVNESAVRAYGWRDTGMSPLGRKIDAMHYGKQGTVVGVIRDANLYSLHNPVQPLIFNLAPEAPYVYVKIGGSDLPTTMQAIERVYRSVITDHPYDYQFLDEKFDKLYDADRKMNKAFVAGGSILMFISCMGLFALSAFIVVRRTKEIGIRKVLGATGREMVVLLSQEYLRLIIIANMIAVALSFLLSRMWLDGYAYRTDFAWWYVVVPIGITVLLAFTSISYQVIVAARANPVRSLKYE